MTNVSPSYSRYLDEVFDLKTQLGFQKKPGFLSVDEKLGRMEICREYLDLLCPDWEKLVVFHVAGSCGKGSTCLMLSAMLAEKYRVGSLLSPHIFDVTERVLVDLKPVSQNWLMDLWFEEFRPVVMERTSGGTGREFQLPSLPEIMLVSGVRFFLEQEVDYVVLETGLGGRFDQTSLFRPLASLITMVSLDHTHILGDTVEQIAREKAGIIKPGVPLFTTEEQEEVLEVFREECQLRKAAFTRVTGEGPGFRLELPEELDTFYNQKNAALAASALVQCLEIEPLEINRGLARVSLPGRLQQQGNTVIDIAHNEAELAALTRTLEQKFPARKKVLVVGMADKKRHRAMLETFAVIARAGNLAGLVFGRAGYRGVPPEELLRQTEEVLGLKGVPLWAVGGAFAAYQKGLKVAEEEGCLVVVTGSTFFVDAVFGSEKEKRD